MSRAGKFIPGGGKQTANVGTGGAGRTGPIRAPTPEPAATSEASPGKPRPFSRASLVRQPVGKKQWLPIMVMSAAVFLFLFICAYYFVYLPEVRLVTDADQRAADMQKQRDDALAAEQRTKEEQARHQNNVLATLTIDSKPTNAIVIIGAAHKKTPASFTDLTPGKVSVLIQADGYEDFKQDVTVSGDTPTDLGTVELTQKVGTLSITSPQSDVTYLLTGPGNYSHEGQLPDRLEHLPIGDYQLSVAQRDWKLPPVVITIHDTENVQKDIKFPYASVSITSAPTGATVREGRTVLGQTPLSLAQLRPGELKLSVDLPPYTIQRFEVRVPDSGNVTKDITLRRDKDFIAACGMPMVWIPDANFWVGKYLMRQAEFEAVAGYNPSNFRGPKRPVEMISWESAMTFCDKLNSYERKAGALPAGYHYTLPTESQWELFSADANINQAAMSRSGAISLTSTQDSPASEPNKYGLYDTLGNVWEWCLDAYDDRGDHSLRGGNWLSSADNFPGPETRNAGGPKYVDRFTGFRVILVPGE